MAFQTSELMSEATSAEDCLILNITLGAGTWECTTGTHQQAGCAAYTADACTLATILSVPLILAVPGAFPRCTVSSTACPA